MEAQKRGVKKYFSSKRIWKTCGDGNMYWSFWKSNIMEIIYLSLIEVIRSTLLYLHVFQLFLLSESKSKLPQASDCCKERLESVKFGYHDKTRQSITSQKLASHEFWWTPNSFTQEKIDMSFFIYLIVLRSCLLSLTRKTSLLKSFLRNLG